MSKYEFWRGWRNKTKVEARAITSIKKAKKILLQNIPAEKIVSIYIKGSFVRREMNEKSDVDIVPITCDNDTLEKIQRLEEKVGFHYKPAEFLPHSLKEFETGKRHLKYSSPKGGVDVTLRNLHRYKLIYGTPLDITKYPIRSDLEFLKGQVHAFKTTFLPLYSEKKLGFSDLMKQVFHLVEREKRLNGKEPPETWKDLATSINDKDHIVHDVLKYRLHPTKDQQVRKKLIRKLQQYLQKLAKDYNLTVLEKNDGTRK